MTSRIQTMLLLGALSALLIGCGGRMGSGYLHGFTALALLVNLGVFLYSNRLVLAASRARELPQERLQACISWWTSSRSRAGIPEAAPLPHRRCPRQRLCDGAELEKLELAGERLPGEAEPATASLDIVNPLLVGSAWSCWFSTYTATRERVRRLRGIAPASLAT